MQEPMVSIIIPAHNEGHRLLDTVLAVRGAADVPYEIIVVDDGSTDGCADAIEREAFEGVTLVRSQDRLGVAGARNCGARRARSSMLLFMDGHCYPQPGFLSLMTRTLRRMGRGLLVPRIAVDGNPEANGFGMTLSGPQLAAAWLYAQSPEPYPVPIGCGCVHMFFRSWFEQIGGYDNMRTYGVEDLEISLRSWLLGGPVYIAPGAVVAHHFRSRTTCNVGWRDVIYNSLRMAHLHFSGARLERILDSWSPHPDYEPATELLIASDVFERRSWLDQRRQRSADWFCEAFDIQI